MMSTGRNFPRRSSDEDAFEVDEAIALESQTRKDMIEDDDADIIIPLFNVTDKMRRMSIGRKVVLKSSDGDDFEVDEAVALESWTIEAIIEDDDDDDNIIIPLSNVTSKILSKVIEYCKKHVETINRVIILLLQKTILKLGMRSLSKLTRPLSWISSWPPII